jgi:hypothetical protein
MTINNTAGSSDQTLYSYNTPSTEHIIPKTLESGTELIHNIHTNSILVEKLIEPINVEGVICTHQIGGKLIGTDKTVKELHSCLEAIRKEAPNFYKVIKENLKKSRCLTIAIDNGAILKKGVAGYWGAFEGATKELRKFRFGIVVDTGIGNSRKLASVTAHEWIHELFSQYSQKHLGMPMLADPCLTTKEANELTHVWFEGYKKYIKKNGPIKNNTAAHTLYVKPSQYFRQWQELEKEIIILKDTIKTGKATNQLTKIEQSLSILRRKASKAASQFRAEVPSHLMEAKILHGFKKVKKMGGIPLCKMMDKRLGSKIFMERCTKLSIFRFGKMLLKYGSPIIAAYETQKEIRHSHHELSGTGNKSYRPIHSVINGGVRVLSNLALWHTNPATLLHANNSFTSDEGFQEQPVDSPYQAAKQALFSSPLMIGGGAGGALRIPLGKWDYGPTKKTFEESRKTDANNWRHIEKKVSEKLCSIVDKLVPKDDGFSTYFALEVTEQLGDMTKLPKDFFQWGPEKQTAYYRELPGKAKKILDKCTKSFNASETEEKDNSSSNSQTVNDPCVPVSDSDFGSYPGWEQLIGIGDEGGDIPENTPASSNSTLNQNKVENELEKSMDLVGAKINKLEKEIEKIEKRIPLLKKGKDQAPSKWKQNLTKGLKLVDAAANAGACYVSKSHEDQLFIQQMKTQAKQTRKDVENYANLHGNGELHIALGQDTIKRQIDSHQHELQKLKNIETKLRNFLKKRRNLGDNIEDIQGKAAGAFANWQSEHKALSKSIEKEQKKWRVFGTAIQFAAAAVDIFCGTGGIASAAAGAVTSTVMLGGNLSKKKNSKQANSSFKFGEKISIASQQNANAAVENRGSIAFLMRYTADVQARRLNLLAKDHRNPQAYREEIAKQIAEAEKKQAELENAVKSAQNIVNHATSAVTAKKKYYTSQSNMQSKAKNSKEYKKREKNMEKANSEIISLNANVTKTSEAALKAREAATFHKEGLDDLLEKAATADLLKELTDDYANKGLALFDSLEELLGPNLSGSDEENMNILEKINCLEGNLNDFSNKLDYYHMATRETLQNLKRLSYAVDKVFGFHTGEYCTPAAAFTSQGYEVAKRLTYCWQAHSQFQEFRRKLSKDSENLASLGTTINTFGVAKFATLFLGPYGQAVSASLELISLCDQIFFAKSSPMGRQALQQRDPVLQYLHLFTEHFDKQMSALHEHIDQLDDSQRKALVQTHALVKNAKEQISAELKAVKTEIIEHQDRQTTIEMINSVDNKLSKLRKESKSYRKFLETVTLKKKSKGKTSTSKNTSTPTFATMSAYTANLIEFNSLSCRRHINGASQLRDHAGNKWLISKKGRGCELQDFSKIYEDPAYFTGLLGGWLYGKKSSLPAAPMFYFQAHIFDRLVAACFTSGQSIVQEKKQQLLSLGLKLKRKGKLLQPLMNETNKFIFLAISTNQILRKIVDSQISVGESFHAEITKVRRSLSMKNTANLRRRFEKATELNGSKRWALSMLLQETNLPLTEHFPKLIKDFNQRWFDDRAGVFLDRAMLPTHKMIETPSETVNMVTYLGLFFPSLLVSAPLLIGNVVISNLGIGTGNWKKEDARLKRMVDTASKIFPKAIGRTTSEIGIWQEGNSAYSSLNVSAHSEPFLFQDYFINSSKGTAELDCIQWRNPNLQNDEYWATKKFCFNKEDLPKTHHRLFSLLIFDDKASSSSINNKHVRLLLPQPKAAKSYLKGRDVRQISSRTAYNSELPANKRLTRNTYDSRITQARKDYVTFIECMNSGKNLPNENLFQKIKGESELIDPSNSEKQLHLALPKILVQAFEQKIQSDITKLHKSGSGTFVKTWSLEKTNDQVFYTIDFEYVSEEKTTEIPVDLRSKQVIIASMDKITFDSFRDAKTLFKNSPDKVKVPNVDINEATLVAFYSGFIHPGMGLPGKKTRRLSLHPKFVAPVDLPFPGFYNILKTFPEDTIHFSSSEYTVEKMKALESSIMKKNIEPAIKEMIEETSVLPGNDYQLVSSVIDAAYQSRAEKLREGNEYGMADEAYKMLVAQLRLTTNFSLEKIQEHLGTFFGLFSPDMLVKTVTLPIKANLKKSTEKEFLHYCNENPSKEYTELKENLVKLGKLLQFLKKNKGSFPKEVKISEKPFRKIGGR